MRCQTRHTSIHWQTDNVQFLVWQVHRTFARQWCMTWLFFVGEDHIVHGRLWEGSSSGCAVNTERIWYSRRSQTSHMGANWGLIWSQATIKTGAHIYVCICIFNVLKLHGHGTTICYKSTKPRFSYHTTKSLLTRMRSCPGAEHTHGVTCRYNAALSY